MAADGLLGNRHISGPCCPMTDEDHKRLRETVLAEIERRKRLLRETEDRPAEHTAEEAEQRSVLKAPDA